MKVNKLDGRWVLVTGAGAGIGRAIALDAAGRGGSVAICDINPEHLEETRALLAGIADRIHQEHEKSTLGPEKVAKAVFSAVRFNTPLRPIAPESWMTYYSNRLSPRLTSFILKQVAHRVLREGVPKEAAP